MTYVFDLDNTLCITTYLEYDNAKPIQKNIDKVNALFDDGHTIIIDSGRYSGQYLHLKHRQRDLKLKELRTKTLNQLDLWGLKYHEVRIGYKIASDFYIDDKAINSEEYFNAD